MEYLSSVWAQRPAKIIAVLAFVGIASLLILVFAAGSESTLFGGTDFSSSPKTNVRVDGNGHVVLDSVLGTDDGSAHLSSSFHYYAGQLPDLAIAQQYAREFEIIVSQTTKTAAFADDMLTANSKLILMPYEKSDQYTAACCTNADFPNSWYSHDSTGAKRYLSTFGVYIMQPGTGYTASATVNGIQGNNWYDYHAKEDKQDVDQANAKVGASAWTGIYSDSVGPSTYTCCGNPPVLPGTTTAYDQDTWVSTVQGIGDLLQGRYPGLHVWGNGLNDGQGFYNTNHPTSVLLDHFQGGLAEGWLHDNNASPTAFKTEAQWVQDEQMVVDANKLGKGVMLVTNIHNDVAAGTNASCTATAAQLNQWRHYGYASYLLANHGSAWWEFVSCVSKATPSSTVEPWTEGANALYATKLGAPLETKDIIGNYKVGGVYMRHYTNGLVLVNPTGSDVTGVALGATYVTEAGASVTSINVPADSGIVLTK